MTDISTCRASLSIAISCEEPGHLYDLDCVWLKKEHIGGHEGTLWIHSVVNYSFKANIFLLKGKTQS